MARHRSFELAVAASVVVGLVIRLAYVARYPHLFAGFIGGDGFDYHLMAARLANGEGYVNGLGAAGENAHHPPGWVTLLAGMVELGVDTVAGQQRVGAVIGVVLIVVVAYTARELFDDRTGIVAGAISAIYPGFWVLDAQLLAEPAGLILLGLSTILVVRLVATPSTVTAIALGIVLGLAILTRSEQAAFLVLVVPVALWRSNRSDRAGRLKLGAIVFVLAIGMSVPWALHNANRFEEPVLLSTNLGPTLLAGNCDTFEGPAIGFYDVSCNHRLNRQESPADRSVGERLAREEALENISENLGKLPVTMLARVGRTIGVYDNAYTVEQVALWHGTEEWPVWLWVTSFWPLLVLAVVGTALAHRAGSWIYPLLVPIAVSFGIVLVFYGEPRYHTPADLGIVILAAFAITQLAKGGVPRPSGAEQP